MTDHFFTSGLRARGPRQRNRLRPMQVQANVFEGLPSGGGYAEQDGADIHLARQQSPLPNVTVRGLPPGGLRMYAPPATPSRRPRLPQRDTSRRDRAVAPPAPKPYQQRSMVDDGYRGRQIFTVHEGDHPQIYDVEKGIDELKRQNPYELTYAGRDRGAESRRRSDQRERLGKTQGTRTRPFHEWPPARTFEAGQIGGGDYVDRRDNIRHGNEFRDFINAQGRYRDRGRRLVPAERFDYLLVPRRRSHD